MALVLIDTNVLVYAYDRGEHTKQAQAIRALEHLHNNQNGRVSVQSLSEFFSGFCFERVEVVYTIADYGGKDFERAKRKRVTRSERRDARVGNDGGDAGGGVTNGHNIDCGSDWSRSRHSCCHHWNYCHTTEER